MYLPDELYALVKKRRLPASELLQDAVRAEFVDDNCSRRVTSTSRS